MNPRLRGGMDSKVSPAAPGNVEQTKTSKKDIESKVARIFKLIKNYGQDSKGKVPDDSKKRTELLRLVEEVHRQYQSLYVQYDRLQGEVGDRARSRKGKNSSSNASSLSSSTSESEYYSSEEKDSENVSTSEDRRHSQASASEEMKQKHDEPKWEQQAALVKVHDIHGSKASAQIKELEGQLTTMRIELETLRGANKDLVAQVEVKASECNKIGGVNSQLQNKVLELELQAKYKGDEVSSIMKKVKDNEKSMMSQIKDLMDQVCHLHSEVEFLRDAKEKLELGHGNIDASVRMKGLEDRVFVMQQEMDTISSQKVELEGQLDARVKEVREGQVEMEALRGETRRMNKSGESWKNEKEGLIVKSKELCVELQSLRDQKHELEVLVEGRDREGGKLREENEELRSKLQSLDHQKQELEKQVRRDADKLREENKRLDLKKEELKIELLSAGNQKRRLEEQTRIKNDQVDQLQAEKDRLVANVSELEGSLAARSQELAKLQKKHDEASDENSAAIVALKLQVKSLQQDMDSLLGEKRVLEMQIEKMKLDSEQKKIEVESKVHNLNSKIADQQRTLKEKEGTMKKEEEHKLVKHLSLEVPKPKPMDSLRLRGSDGPRINQHALERKVEELADKFQMKMENHIRLLYQRILVAEQIHSETKDSYKKIKDTLQQENEELNEKLAMFESGLQGFKELFSEQGINPSAGEDTTAKRAEDDHHQGDFLTRIGNILNGIQSARDWIAEKNNEIKELRYNVESLTRRLESSEEKEKLIKEKLQKLEEQVQQEKENYNVDASIKLEARVEYLEEKLKEREEVLLCLVDEKREAIRQLSIFIDYHRSRYDDLKLVVLKMAGRKRRAA